MSNSIKMDLASVIDWLSIKITGGAVVLAFMTGNKIVIILGMIATASTIIYNGIKIYKELKNKNK